MPTSASNQERDVVVIAAEVRNVFLDRMRFEVLHEFTHLFIQQILDINYILGSDEQYTVTQSGNHASQTPHKSNYKLENKRKK